jgi:flagellar basal-body rod modification protein FlgD
MTVNTGTANLPSVNAQAATTTNTGTDSSASTAKLSADLNTFLKLLTTQLKNQDPTNPQDPSQFTQQLAQYSQVEQTIQSNSNLEKLLASQNQTILNGAVSYIGKSVVTEDNKLVLSGGQAKFSYAITGNPASVKITIKNGKGEVVRQIDADKTNDTYNLTWDGKDDGGNALASGVYTVSVEAKDTKEVVTSVSTKIVNNIQGLKFVNGSPILLSQGKEITLDKILEITSA